MKHISKIDAFAEDWHASRLKTYDGLEPDHIFACSAVRRSAPPRALSGLDFPIDLQIFWKTFQRVLLFEDTLYGQWGLELFSFEEASAETGKYRKTQYLDARRSDFVLGRFLGDSDLLIFNKERASGSILIVVPVEPRSEWPIIASCFEEFVCTYCDGKGAKFWEIS